ITARVDEAAKGLARPRPREPLEIVHAILDAVEQQIEPTGRGTRVFPFNRIEISVVAPSSEARGRLEAVFRGDVPLRTRIVDRLLSAGCSLLDIVVAVHYVDRAGENWRAPDFDLQFARVTDTAVESRERNPNPARIEVTVLRGAAERRTYSLVSSRID